MRRAVIGALLTILLLVAGTRVLAQSDLLTGRAYIQNWPSGLRTTYVSGFTDGMVASFDFQRSGTFDAIRTCTMQWTVAQFEAVISKYVRDHPEQWHRDISILARTAIAEACRGFVRP